MTRSAVVRGPSSVSVNMGIGQIRRHIGMQIWRETINRILCLAVILINDTYVANLYQWSSLIRICYAKM